VAQALVVNSHLAEPVWRSLMKPSRLLSAQDKWCKFDAAQSSDGGAVSPFSPLAVKWDLSSSISCYTGLPLRQSELRIRATEAYSLWEQDNAKSQWPCQRTIADFNDTTSWPWIVLALKQANL
jgi:hypothetical protein